MPRRRYAKPGDILQLRTVLWQTILDTKALTDGSDAAPEMVLKVAHALAQLAGPYRQLLETSDLEARLAALETRFSGDFVSNGTP
jgi:hypothetical protein